MSTFKSVSGTISEIKSTFEGIKSLYSSSTIAAGNSYKPDYDSLLSLPSLLSKIHPALKTLQENLSKRDPVTDAPRYGPNMVKKVENTISEFEEISFTLASPAYTDLLEKLRELSGEEEESARIEREKIEAERELKEIQKERARQAEEQEKRRIEKERKEAEERERERELLEAQERVQAQERVRREEAARDLQFMTLCGVGPLKTAIQLQTLKISAGASYRSVIKALVRVFEQIISRPEEVNFRRIRLQNSNFHEAIGKYDGGIGVIVTGGFKIRYLTVDDNEDKYLVLSEPNLEGGELEEWGIWFDCLKGVLTALKNEVE